VQEPEAQWNVWWGILDHIDDPGLRPDAKRFSKHSKSHIP